MRRLTTSGMAELALGDRFAADEDEAGRLVAAGAGFFSVFLRLLDGSNGRRSASVDLSFDLDPMALNRECQDG
jgi:hypothetical protein